ncbi:MAG: AAA family ATPase [Candidatus Woesearchaeota archaeon]
MLLRSIKLSNIRSYIDQFVSFSDGNSLLLGDIGSGKTTVLLAIEFALFGLIKGDVTGSTLLRHGKSEGFVQLDFEIDKKSVTIMRRLKRKKDVIAQDSGFIIIDDKKYELTPVELKSKILELFGYPEDLLNKNTSLIYRYTVYTPQEEMKNILFESREERLDILRKIFNIDKYKRIRENALNYAKDLRNTKKIFETKVGDVELLKKSVIDKALLLQNSSDEKNIVESEILERSKLLDALNANLKKIQGDIEKINVLKREFAIIDTRLKSKILENEKNSKEINMYDFRINDYETKLKDLGIIDQDEESLRETLKDAEEKLTKINSAKETIRERLESRQNDLKNMLIDDSASLKIRYDVLKKNVQTKDQKSKEYDNIKKQHDAILLDINTIIISQKNSEKILENFKDLSICPTCMQNVDFTHKIKITDKENLNILSSERKQKELGEKKSSFEKELSKLKSDIESIHDDEIELKSVEIKLDNLTRQKEKKEQLQSEIEELLKKKEKVDSIDINKLVESISKNRKILNNVGIKKHLEESLLEKRKQKLDAQEQLKIIQSSIEDLKKEMMEKNVLIESFAKIEDEYKKKYSEKEELQIILKNLEIKASLLQKDIETTSKEITRIKEEIGLKEKLIEKINYITDLNHWITEYFIDLTSAIEKNIMRKVHGEFNELFKEWFSIIVQDQELDVQIDEDFAPSIRQNNYDTTIDNLSGGEKTAVALAYRLALNKVINDFINNIKTKDLIILDEPTDGFSSEQLDRMRDVLDSLKVKQLIIVSHEAKMESYAEHIIRIYKNNHVSGAA